MDKLNHFDDNGNAIMVNISQKDSTERIAVAKGRISMKQSTLEAIVKGGVKKGDVLGAARIAGIMATKKTSELIPLCHPIALEHVVVEFEVDDAACEVKAVCTTRTTGKTGVEMEALAGVTMALLTIYDMCKAVDRGMEISAVCVEMKDGGKSGLFQREE